MSSIKGRQLLSCAGLSIALALSCASQASAHFMWIETDATAHPGSAQSIRLYFGEYQEFLREESKTNIARPSGHHGDFHGGGVGGHASEGV